MFYDVFEILLQNNNISLGDVIRLTRVDRTLYTFINSHQLLGIFKSHELGFKRKYPIHNIIQKIKQTNRCRECGYRYGLKTLSTKSKCVHICSTCAQEKNSYSELICRYDIFRNEKCVWSKKRRIILAGLHLARVGRNNKYFYWGFEWKKPLRRL